MSRPQLPTASRPPGQQRLVLLVLRSYRNPRCAHQGDGGGGSVIDLTFRWGGGYCEAAPYGRGKVARYYMAETTQVRITLPISPELGRPRARRMALGELR